MAGLLWQLHHLGMAMVADVAGEGDGLLQVHLQGQQARMPLMSPQYRGMHPLQLPAHDPHSGHITVIGQTLLLVCRSTHLQRPIAQGLHPLTVYTFLHSNKMMHVQPVMHVCELQCLLATASSKI